MHRSYVMIATFFLLTTVAFGQETDGLSLREALQIAYEHSPRMVTARQDVEAAKGRWMQVRTLPNPEVEISTTELSEGLRGGSTVGEDSVVLSQEVDVLGKFWLRGKAAKADYEAAQHTLQRMWNEVTFEATRAYNNLLLSTQRVSVAREVLELTRRLLDQVQLRYNAGEALRNELLRSQIEVAEAENTVLQAEKQVTLDTASLNVLLGREAQLPILPSDELTYEAQDFDLEQLTAQALAHRPDLMAQEATLHAQQKRLQLARHDILDNPTVSAIGTREKGEAGTERVFGLAVRVPLPFWNQNQGAIREARAELTKRQTERDALIREVGREVMSAVAEARLAQRQVTVWRSAVEQANELMRLASLQYGEGDINFVTYLEHLAAAQGTKVAYVESLANYHTQLALLNQAVAVSLAPPDQEGRLR